MTSLQVAKHRLTTHLYVWVAKITLREGPRICVKTSPRVNWGRACGCEPDYPDGGYRVALTEVLHRIHGPCKEVSHSRCGSIIGWRKGELFFPRS